MARMAAAADAAELDRAMRHDWRIAKIAALFGARLTLWADRNSAGWVLDRLADDGPAAVRGVLVGRRACDVFVEGQPGMLAMVAR